MKTPLLALVLVGCSGKTEPVDDGPTNATTDTETGPTVVPPGCPAVTGVSVVDGVQLLEKRLTVTLDEASPVYAVCTSADQPLEQLLVEGTADADSHELIVRGLMANTAYSCDVRPTCGGPRVSGDFTTGTPSGIPLLTATMGTGTMSGAYTLFNTQQGCGGEMQWLLIADPDGKIRWMYPAGTDLVTDIDAYLVDADTIHLGGGWGIFDNSQSNRGIFRTIDLSGRPLVERTTPDFGLGFNHHSERLSDGSYLTITGHDDTNGNETWDGVGVEHWDPTAGLLWTWDSQHLVDIGYLDPPSPFDFLPYHANASSFVSDALGEALWLSNFGKEALWRIDRATGELTHVFGADGDFTLVDTQGNALPDSEFPYVQHGPDYTDDGRVLLYDNGSGRPGGSYSRVAEYRLDLPTKEATLLWSWTETGWYNPILGDADYLPNGNVLIAQGVSTCLTPFENDVSEIIELDPPNDVVWRLTWPARAWSLYRAERLDGCDVFGNARYCDATADRIADLDAL